MHHCPCCGSSIQAPRAVMHRSTIKYQDGAAVLSPHQTRLVEVLLRHPSGLSPDALVARLWANVPGGEPDSAGTGLRVHVHEARKKLKPLGLDISFEYGVYRLHESTRTGGAK